MRELSRYIFLMGALPFVVLGRAHVCDTARAGSQATVFLPLAIVVAGSTCCSGLGADRRDRVVERMLRRIGGSLRYRRVNDGAGLEDAAQQHSRAVRPRATGDSP
jgi:hypothetical protein